MKGSKFKIDGKEYSWILTTNATIRMETSLQGNFGFIELREFMHMGLQTEQPDVSLEDAGEIIDALGYRESLRIMGQGQIDLVKKFERLKQ